MPTFGPQIHINTAALEVGDGLALIVHVLSSPDHLSPIEASKVTIRPTFTFVRLQYKANQFTNLPRRAATRQHVFDSLLRIFTTEYTFAMERTRNSDLLESFTYSDVPERASQYPDHEGLQPLQAEKIVAQESTLLGGDY